MISIPLYLLFFTLHFFISMYPFQFPVNYSYPLLLLNTIIPHQKFSSREHSSMYIDFWLMAARCTPHSLFAIMLHLEKMRLDWTDLRFFFSVTIVYFLVIGWVLRLGFFSIESRILIPLPLFSLKSLESMWMSKLMSSNSSPSFWLSTIWFFEISIELCYSGIWIYFAISLSSPSVACLKVIPLFAQALIRLFEILSL